MTEPNTTLVAWYLYNVSMKQIQRAITMLQEIGVHRQRSKFSLSESEVEHKLMLH